MDWHACRRWFPVTDDVVFLNNAAESPLCQPVRRRLDEYLDAAARTPHRRPPARSPVRPLLARLLGGLPEEYALVTSTGAGLGLAAAGYRWARGDNMVVPASEHWNNTFPWLALRERGVDVRVVPVGTGGRIDPEALAERIDDATRIVAIAAVRHVSGFRPDLRRCSRLAHERGALFVVDAIQAAGVVPVNVDDDGIDVMACGGFKWLLGMPGTGCLYVRRDAWDRIRPAMPGMFAAEDDLTALRWLPDARRYETGSLAHSLFYAWTAGLEWLHDIGVGAIHARVLALTSHLLGVLRTAGMAVTSPVDSVEERSAVVSFTAGSADTNAALVERLAQHGVIIAHRGGVCRVSPSFYNTEEEIDRLGAVLVG